MSIQLTPEEEARILSERSSNAQEDADRRALQAILGRAKSVSERQALEKMIQARGGPKVRTCKCGAAVSPESGELHECAYCYARGYGK